MVLEWTSTVDKKEVDEMPIYNPKELCKAEELQYLVYSELNRRCYNKIHINAIQNPTDKGIDGLLVNKNGEVIGGLEVKHSENQNYKNPYFYEGGGTNDGTGRIRNGMYLYVKLYPNVHYVYVDDLHRIMYFIYDQDKIKKMLDMKDMTGVKFTRLSNLKYPGYLGTLNKYFKADFFDAVFRY